MVFNKILFLTYQIPPIKEPDLIIIIYKSNKIIVNLLFILFGIVTKYCLFYVTNHKYTTDCNFSYEYKSLKIISYIEIAWAK